MAQDLQDYFLAYAKLLDAELVEEFDNNTNIPLYDLEDEFMKRVTPSTLVSLAPFAYNSITAEYTIVNTDKVVEAKSGTFDVFLPATPFLVGQWFVITNSGAGVVTLDGNGNNINGLATNTITTDESRTVLWNGTEWRII